MKKFALVAAMVAFAPSAFAADLMMAAPVQPVAMTDAGFDWSGFYAGLNGGYAGFTADATTVLGTTTIDGSGALLGGTVGYNAQFGSFVLGVEGDIAWSNASGSAVCAPTPAFDCFGDLDWLGTVKARAGFAADRVLFFATAGFAAGGVTASFSPDAPGLTGTYSDTATGWTVGGGVEAAVTEAISVKAEYNYVDLGDVTAPVGTLSGAGDTTISSSAHVVKLGVNFHF